MNLLLSVGVYLIIEVSCSFSVDEYDIDVLLMFPFSCQISNETKGNSYDYVNCSLSASLEFVNSNLKQDRVRWDLEDLCHKTPSQIANTLRDYYNKSESLKKNASVVVFGSFYSAKFCELVSLLGRLLTSTKTSLFPFFLITWECTLQESEMSEDSFKAISSKPQTNEAAMTLYLVFELFRMTGVRVISLSHQTSYRRIAKELILLYSTAYFGKTAVSSVAELLFVSLSTDSGQVFTNYFEHKEYIGDARRLWDALDSNSDDMVLLMPLEEAKKIILAAENQTRIEPHLLLLYDYSDPLKIRKSHTLNDTWYLDVDLIPEGSTSSAHDILSKCIILKIHNQKILTEKGKIRTNVSISEYSLYHEHAYNAILLAQQLYMGLSRTSYNNQEIYLMGGWTRLREDGRVPIYYSLWAWVGASNYRVVIEGSIHEPGKFSLVDDYVEILGNLLPKYLCNERCLPDHTKEIASSTVFLVIFLVCVASAALYWIRRKMVFKELTRGKKKILIMPEDVALVHGKLTNQSSASVTHRGENKHGNGFKSEGSIGNLEFKSRICRYNGDLVFMKELAIKNFQINSKLQNHLKLLQELRHENLNPFVGCFIDPARPALLYEYCSRSSLSDILHNEDFNLDWEFKISLLTDLIMGMKYLHGSSITAHGNLNSHNCVIDTRWVLKITDFGIRAIYDLYRSQCKIQKKEDLLWTAPEILRQGELMRQKTQKGDVYSFAIVMQEVILRVPPFSMLGKETEDVLNKILKPPPLCRPVVSPGAAPPEYIQLMKQCWGEHPDTRPTFEEIASKIKAWNKGRKMNIVDAMFRKLEKYSNDLEEIVRVRTLALEEERKKTESLLTQMLPASVAQSLLGGNPVDPESYDEVTVYFSDIVGFTTISAMSSPMQVVRLLNDLYTMFDATIDDYDVYKVETIGDAYMACSGLPVRNGDRHAGEISTMALDLLSKCGQFQIWHMPDIPLRIRIGIHTGSCVAGVVGLRMPRFCLFGDTVNTASRMESTSTAFRIHVSWTTREKLVELGGYNILYRGEVELKGKGKFKTYWLVGKAGFDKPLPEPPVMVGDDNHGLEAYILKKTESN